MPRTSIKDIAEKLGISSATVSLVLNGKGEKLRISKEVAERVQTAARELNYRPNIAARSLRTGKTKTLGLIVADISNPFFARLARHIENFAGEKGYQVMFGSSDESAVKFQKLVDLFIQKNVDGVIVAPPQDSEDSITQLIGEKIPCVLIDRGFDGFSVSSVQIDNEQASYVLTKRLIGEGCRRIAFVAYNMGLPNIAKRYKGYSRALSENGVISDERWVKSVTYENFEAGIDHSIDELLDREIDAFVFATNKVGIQSLMRLRRLNRISEFQFASIDYADEYILADLPVICTGQPVKELGERALDILFKQIDDPFYDVVEQVVLQARVIG